MQFSFHTLWFPFSHVVYQCQNFTFCLKSSLISSNPITQFLLCSPVGALVSLLCHLRPSVSWHSYVPYPWETSALLCLPEHQAQPFLLHTDTIKYLPNWIALIGSLAKTGSKYGWESWALGSWWPGLHLGGSRANFGSFLMHHPTCWTQCIPCLETSKVPTVKHWGEEQESFSCWQSKVSMLNLMVTMD